MKHFPRQLTIARTVAPISALDSSTSLNSAMKELKCQHCAFRCMDKTNLTRHIRYHHTGKRPHQCPFCSYRCITPHILKIHLRTHTGEKPFQCPVCSARFADPSNFSKHKMKYHPKELL